MNFDEVKYQILNPMPGDVLTFEFGDALAIDTPIIEVIDDLGADSLTAVEIVMELEKELGVDIDDSEVEKIVTVQDVINIVEAKK